MGWKWGFEGDFSFDFREEKTRENQEELFEGVGEEGEEERDEDCLGVDIVRQNF